jgi:serine/threonine protein kinase
MTESKTRYSALGYSLTQSAYTLTGQPRYSSSLLIIRAVTAELGKGAYATVYRAQTTLQNGRKTEVAVKILEFDRFEVGGGDDGKHFGKSLQNKHSPCSALADTCADTLAHEVHTLSELKDDNVMPIFGSFVEARELWVIMKLFAGGR